MRLNIIIISIIFSSALYSQTIKGVVMSKDGNKMEIITGANVYWLNTQTVTTTDNKGEFSIKADNIQDKRLIVSFIGFQNDTIKIINQTQLHVHLNPLKTLLKEVEIKGRAVGSHLSKMESIKTEIINQKELTKASCCDLSGCFGNDATVQASTTNVITNSKELKILGLSGVYNQVLVDGMPLIQGLNYTYGVSSIPGTLIDNIYVSKGANSILQGYESFAGQINVLMRDPQYTDKLYFNLYSNQSYEKNFNANYTYRKNKISNIISVNTTQPSKRYDTDGDNFLDMPLVTRYMVYDKFRYGYEDSLGFSSRTAVMYQLENRLGGQKDFTKEDKGSSKIYGQIYDASQPSFYTKSGFRFSPKKKITLILSGFNHDQDSYFGETHYKAFQNNIYSNLQYEWRWNEENMLKTGVSFRHSKINEQVSFTTNPNNKSYAHEYITDEEIPGIFAENTTLLFKDKLTLISGLRLDKHNQYGYFVTPRIFLKYIPNQKNIFRGSVGLATRTTNIFSENINLLASQRDVIFTEKLNPERAINFGLNYTHYIEMSNLTGTISMDLYHTSFYNQVFPDYDTDPTKAYISNFTGKSESYSFQVEANLKLYELFSIKAAYNYQDVYRIEGGNKKVLPFNPKDRLLFGVSFEPMKGNWQFDVNTQWYGIQQLPSTQLYPPELMQASESKPYSIVNAQITKKYLHFEIYFGAENLTDFKQNKPIMGWEKPFGQYFDTSYIWGPTKGREFYLGIRIKI